MWNGVHQSKVVFQKSWGITNDFRGYQLTKVKLDSARAHMIGSISSTIFSSCDDFTKTQEITLELLEITVRGRKSELSMEEMVLKCSYHHEIW